MAVAWALLGLQLAFAAVAPSENVLTTMAKSQEPCLGRERGIHWPRVRHRLAEHLLAPADAVVAPGVVADQRAPAWRARDVLEPELPAGTLASFETLREESQSTEFKCLIGWAALSLLVCAAPAEGGEAGAGDAGLSEACVPEALERPAKVALGLERWNSWRILREGWPMPALLMAALAQPRGLAGHGLTAWGWEPPARHIISSNKPASATLLEVVCPYRPPFDEVLCGFHADRDEAVAEDEEILATASMYLVAALQRVEQNAAQVGASDAPASEHCLGLEPICRLAIVDKEVRESLSQAQGLVRRVLRHTTPAEALDLLASGRWRLVEPLAHMLVVLEGREAPEPVSSEKARVAWSCSQRRWTAFEAGSVAAAMRLLSLLLEAGDNSEMLWEATGGKEAEAACEVLQPRQTLENLLRQDAGTAAKPDSVYYHVMAAAHALEDHPSLPDLAPEEFDAGTCLPGMFAVVAACSVVAIRRNDVQGWYILSDLAMMHGKLLVRSRPREVDERWMLVFPFLQRSLEVVKHMWDALLRTNRWWLGSEAVEGPEFGEQPDAPQASPCFGVVEANESHSCHQQSSGDAVSFRSVELANKGMPLISIFGVGLLKAGSTAVIQALRAALLWPTGFDCDPRKISAAILVRRVRRREDSLHSLLTACGRELFAFELAKDQMFTPLAHRLHSAWPAISSTGKPLRLYFVVRNPFNFVLSMVNRLDLEVKRGLPAEQVFTVRNLPESFPRDFQIYLDVEEEGLNYTGYIDAMVQRWALEVDEYLRCPHIFALVRYEDFKQDPVATTQQLLLQLGHGHVWSQEAAKRVALATSVRYQRWGEAGERTLEDSLGGPLMHRIWEAVGSRARQLGYGDLEQKVVDADAGESGLWPAPVHMPPLPELRCGA